MHARGRCLAQATCVAAPCTLVRVGQRDGVAVLRLVVVRVALVDGVVVRVGMAIGRGVGSPCNEVGWRCRVFVLILALVFLRVPGALRVS